MASKRICKWAAIAAAIWGCGASFASAQSPTTVTDAAKAASTASLTGYGCFPPPLNTLCFGLEPGEKSPSQVPYGSAIFLDALVGGATTVTGTVTFAGGSTVLGTVSVGAGNQAWWPPQEPEFPFIPPGTYAIKATYSGDAGLDPSTSAAIPLTISKGSTGTTASASAKSIGADGSVTITVQVGSVVNPLPTGSVTLTANGKTLATITAFSGVPPGTIQGSATIEASRLAIGPNIITASYGGDSYYLPSSTTVAVTVTGAPKEGFTLSNGGGIAIRPGATTGQSTIAVKPFGGFTGAVALTCAITTAPGAIEGAESPQCTLAQSVTLHAAAVTTPITIAAPSNTLAGAYVLTISGTDQATGQVLATTQLKLVVGPAYGFALNNGGNIAVTDNDGITNDEPIAVTAFGGFSGTVNLNCKVTWTSALAADAPTCGLQNSVEISTGEVVVFFIQVETTSETTPGIYFFNVTGTDAATGKRTSETAFQVTILADSTGFLLSNSGNIDIGLNAKTARAITVTPFGGFKGDAMLTCSWQSNSPAFPNYPECVTPQQVAVTGTRPVKATLRVTTFPDTTPGAYTLTVAGEDKSTGVVVYTALDVAVSPAAAAP